MADVGANMTNSGGTILSGAHVRPSLSPSLNRGRMRALLLSSALATVLAGVLQPGTAQAACTVNATTVDCSGASVPVLLPTLFNVDVTTANDTVINAGPFVPMTVATLSNINLNNVGGSFTGGIGGLIFGAGGDIRQAPGTTFGATVVSGVPGSSAVVLIAGDDITFSSRASANVTGAENGLFAVAVDNVNITTVGGAFTGTNGDGMFLAGQTVTLNASGLTGFTGGDDGIQIDALGSVNAQNFAAVAKGEDNGIEIHSLVGPVNISGFNGVAIGTAGDGIHVDTVLGNITANNFQVSPLLGLTNIAGGVNAVSLQTGLGNINANNFAATAVGGQNGIFAETSFGNININGFTGAATGTAKDGIVAHTSIGDINVNNFSGSAKGGVNGLNLVADNGDLNVTGFSGTAQGTSQDGIFGSADGIINVTTKGAAKITGGQSGISLVQRGDNVNAIVGGTTEVSGGDYGIHTFSEYTATGDVYVGTAAGTTVTGTALAGIFVDKTSIEGNVSVVTAGTVKGTNGTGIEVSSVIDKATETRVETSGPVSGGKEGIYADTISNLESAKSTITTNGPVSGGTGTAITGFATAMSGGGDATSIVAQHGVIADSVNGIKAYARAGDVATTDVLADNSITVSGFGIRALAEGKTGSLKVTTTDKGTIDAGTTGITALASGNDFKVDVETNAKIKSGGDGILANLTGTGTVNVTNKAEIDAGSSGIIAGNTGGDTNVTVDKKISADGLFGAAAFAAGGGNAHLTVNAEIDPPIIGGAAVTFGSGTATADVNAPVYALAIGIVGANIGTGAIVVNVNPNDTGAFIDSNGIGIATFKLGDNATGTTVNVNGAVTAKGGDGIASLSIGASPVTIKTGTKGTITAADDGISVNQVGSGKVEIETNAKIVAGDEGIEVYSLALAPSDVLVTNNAAIEAKDNGIFILKAGSGNVGVAANANITAETGNGIEANSLFGTGNVKVSQGASTAIAAQDFGIIATKSFGTGNVEVLTGDLSSIKAGQGGIVALKAFGDATTPNGNAVSVQTGAGSSILTPGDGIYAGQLFGAGNVLVSTGAGSTIGLGTATDKVADGIVAQKIGGTGDVNVYAGSKSAIFANDDGIVATNFAFGNDTDGTGNDVLVQLASGTGPDAEDRTRVVARDNAIVAGGWDNVTVATGSYGRIYGDQDNNGNGNAIRIFEADVATIKIGDHTRVSGAGTSWSQAVISVRSDDATNMIVGPHALVSSNAYAVYGDLVTAAADIVIDTDGGKTTIDNSGDIVGRVGLTNKDDVFNILPDGTWITAGLPASSYFGLGFDRVNNGGLVQTALRGTVAETTNFFSLEEFNNTGTLSMIDGELPGDLPFDAQRDVTYTSGIFSGSGASTLGVDTFLGKAGSTSDVLKVGGLDAGGNEIAGLVTPGQTQILVNDVNAGAGAFNLQGILVVDVVDPLGVTFGKKDVGETASFVISPDSANYSSKFGGVIDKGLFFYDLAVIGNDQYLIGLPDQEVFELPKLVTGAQTVWQETTGVWLDRQADLRTYLQGTTTTLVTKTGVQTVSGAPGNVTPGVWGKAIGSWGSRDATDSISAYGRTYSFDTSYSQNVYGFMAGADFGKEGVWSTNDAVVFGVLGGYVASNLEFDNSPTTADYSGGTVGAYATYLNDAFFFDALFKADFMSMDYSASTLTSAGYFGQSSDVTNLGFVLDSGYRLMKWGSTGFVDGLATLSYVNTSIDDLALVPGTVVDFGNNDSLRASIGARVGAQAYDAATYRLEASVTARLWYEFLGDNAVTIFNPGTPFTTIDNFDGAFGEVAVGLNAFGKDNGWNSFVNGAVKFGEDYTAGSAKGGVRYQW